MQPHGRFKLGVCALFALCHLLCVTSDDIRAHIPRQERNQRAKAIVFLLMLPQKCTDERQPHVPIKWHSLHSMFIVPQLLYTRVIIVIIIIVIRSSNNISNNIIFSIMAASPMSLPEPQSRRKHH